jgi:hypothetical protein
MNGPVSSAIAAEVILVIATFVGAATAVNAAAIAHAFQLYFN